MPSQNHQTALNMRVVASSLSNRGIPLCTIDSEAIRNKLHDRFSHFTNAADVHMQPVCNQANQVEDALFISI